MNPWLVLLVTVLALVMLAALFVLAVLLLEDWAHDRFWPWARRLRARRGTGFIPLPPGYRRRATGGPVRTEPRTWTRPKVEADLAELDAEIRREYPIIEVRGGRMVEDPDGNRIWMPGIPEYVEPEAVTGVAEAVAGPLTEPAGRTSRPSVNEIYQRAQQADPWPAIDLSGGDLDGIVPRSDDQFLQTLSAAIANATVETTRFAWESAQRTIVLASMLLAESYEHDHEDEDEEAVTCLECRLREAAADHLRRYPPNLVTAEDLRRAREAPDDPVG